MPSTYSTNLAIELIGTGDQAGVWGNTTNTNLGTLIEQAISGYVTQAVSTGTDTTITIPNGATGVARNMYIELTGTGGASTNLIVPANKKLYFIFNNTSSGQVTVKVSGQTGVSVPNGKKMVLVSNGTDIVDATNYLANLSAASANITVLTSASATITNLLATSLTVSSGSTLNGGVVINEPGADADTRIEGDTDANLFFADASTDRIGIGTSSPGYKLEVVAPSGDNITALFRSGDATAANNAGGGFRSISSATAASRLAQVWLDADGANLSGGDYFFIQKNGNSGTADIVQFSNAAMTFATNNTTRMTLDASGNLGIGTSSPAGKFHVKLDTNKNVLIDAGGTGSCSRITAGNDALSANVDFQIQGLNLIFATAGNERARIDSSGNLGLGVTPSAWGSIFNAMQLGDGGFIAGRSDVATQLQLGCNGFYDGSNFKYIATGTATRYYMDTGAHYWENAASGTAGNAITFTQAMTLDASGNLAMGSSASSARIVLTQPSGDGTVKVSGDGTNYGFWRSTGSAQFDLGTASALPVTFYTNNTERGRFTSGGDFLVGGTTAESKLNVYSGGSTFSSGTVPAGMTIFGNTNDGQGSMLSFKAGSGDQGIAGIAGVRSSGYQTELRFYTNNTNSQNAFTERARITSGGDLLVGTTTGGGANTGITLYGGGTARFISDGQNTANTVSNAFTNSNSNNTDLIEFNVGQFQKTCIYVRNSGAGAGNTVSHIVFQYGTTPTTAGSITSVGTTVTYGSASDTRLKNDLGVSTESRIADVVIHDFEWKSTGVKAKGAFAQELHQIAPEAVVVGNDDVNDNGELKMPWQIDYSKLVPDLIVEIQALRARVAALEAK